MRQTPDMSGAATHAPSPSSVLRMLDMQAALFHRLENLSRRQGDLIIRDDAGPLLALLNERRQVTSDLLELGQRLGPVRRAWAAYRGRLEGEDADRADKLVAQISERMERVIQRDEADARILAQRKSQAGSAIGEVAASQHVISAYASRAAPRRLDEVHES